MSRATLLVKFPGGKIRCGIYNGTCDIACPPLFDSIREAWTWWREHGDFPEYEEGSGEPVEVYSDYGNGFWWRATATHDALTSNHDIMEVDEQFNGKPDWASQNIQRL